MPIDKLRAAIILALSLSCAACASTGQVPPTPLAKDDFGWATRETLAAQIVNPAPAYDGRPILISADHAVQAAERYRTDKVKLPVQPKTSKTAAPDSAN